MVWHEVAGIAIGFLALAAFVAAISPKAQTGNVIKSSADGFNQILGTATGPIQ
jgi:hypothetical protein